MTLKARMAVAGDVKQLIKARFDFFNEEKWEMTSGQRDAMKRLLRQYFTRHLNIDFFAAMLEDAGQIVSIAFLVVLEKPANPFFPTGKTGTIFNVFTYPAYRRKGFATRLMKMLIEEGKRHGLSFLDLCATADGKVLYQKLGFREEKTVEFTEMKLSLLG